MLYGSALPNQLNIAVRYIALLAMVKIIPTHPHMVSEYQDEILESLDDPDVSIRMRALELVSAMVSLGVST
jgi:AP-3 complex subunit delta-1